MKKMKTIISTFFLTKFTFELQFSHSHFRGIDCRIRHNILVVANLKKSLHTRVFDLNHYLKDSNAIPRSPLNVSSFSNMAYTITTTTTNES